MNDVRELCAVGRQRQNGVVESSKVSIIHKYICEEWLVGERNTSIRAHNQSMCVLIAKPSRSEWTSLKIDERDIKDMHVE